jgi:integrase
VTGTVFLPPAGDEFLAVRRLLLDAVSSPLTRALYAKALADFFAWREGQGRPPFTRAAVQAHRTWLEQQGHGPSTINQRLAAIKKLAREAAANGLLDAAVAAGIREVPGAKLSGNRAGNWLTRDQAQALLDLPDPKTLKGKRDRAILALLVGCGLRRSEAAALDVGQIQQREGRWVIPDLLGKHGRLRTIPVPAWVKQAIDDWTAAARIAEGRLLRAMDRHGRITGASISPQAILDLVAHYGQKLGVNLKAHDARRTCAKLCRAAGADLEQIQLLLGHASVQTTERYLGTRQDLVEAPNDRLGLRWNRPADPPEPTAQTSEKKTAVVELCLRVENNNKFVRGKKRARADIENYHLRLYGMRKVGACDYELTFSYTDDTDLDQQVCALLRDISNEAELRYCFIEADAHEKDGERSW